MQGLRQIGETISELDLDAMMGLMDVDGDGSIDYREFVKVGQMKDELADMQEVRKPPSRALHFRKVFLEARKARERESTSSSCCSIRSYEKLPRIDSARFTRELILLDNILS